MSAEIAYPGANVVLADGRTDTRNASRLIELDYVGVGLL